MKLFEQRHLQRLREMVQHLDKSIALDEARGGSPHRKYASRSALQGVLSGAEQLVELQLELRRLRAELSQVRR